MRKLILAAAFITLLPAVSSAQGWYNQNQADYNQWMQLQQLRQAQQDAQQELQEQEMMREQQQSQWQEQQMMMQYNTCRALGDC